MLHELQHDKGTRKTGKSKLTCSFCDDGRRVVRNHSNHLLTVWENQSM